MLTQPFSVSSLALPPSSSSPSLSARIRAKVRLSIRCPLPPSPCLFDLAMCSHCIFVVSVAMFRTDTSSQSTHFLPPLLHSSFSPSTGFFLVLWPALEWTVQRATCYDQRAWHWSSMLRSAAAFSSSTCISGPPQPLAFYAIFYLLLS